MPSRYGGSTPTKRAIILSSSMSDRKTPKRVYCKKLRDDYRLLISKNEHLPMFSVVKAVAARTISLLTSDDKSTKFSCQMEGYGRSSKGFKQRHVRQPAGNGRSNNDSGKGALSPPSRRGSRLSTWVPGKLGSPYMGADVCHGCRFGGLLLRCGAVEGYPQS